MPILWRYLLSQYLRIIILCILVFIAVLLTMRLEDIAQFISLKADLWYVLLFIFYQIPYIVPIALPISSLIAATLLSQNLSTSQEITAWRSAGFSLKNLLSPLIIVAILLSLLNFVIVSEFSTRAHLSAGFMKSQLRSINPLLLLANRNLMELKGIHFDILGESQQGEAASDIILAMPNKHHGRLNVLIAKKLQAAPSHFTGQQVTLISSTAKELQNSHLLIENMRKVDISIPDLTKMLRKQAWSINHDHLNLPLLLIRLDETRSQLNQSINLEESKHILAEINKIYSEIIRRFSLSFAVFTFTLMGMAFGINIGRGKNAKRIWSIVSLSSLFIISIFLGKTMEAHFIVTLAVYLIPHLLIIFLSMYMLKRISLGLE